MNTNQKLEGLHIVVVEDDPKGMDVLCTLLKFHGARVTPAMHGLEGLSFTRQLKPDLVISDLSMPVMNGWKMIETLKQDRSTQDIPIIALTAHAMRGDREKAIAAGCHNYLTKPLNPLSFVDTLITMVEDLPEFSTRLGS